MGLCCLKTFSSKMDPVNLSEVLIYDIVASKIILLDSPSRRGSPYKSTCFNIIGQNIKIFKNGIYTIHKIDTIFRKMMAVQQVMRCVFSLQTART